MAKNVTKCPLMRVVCLREVSVSGGSTVAASDYYTSNIIHLPRTNLVKSGHLSGYVSPSLFTIMKDTGLEGMFYLEGVPREGGGGGGGDCTCL